MCSAAMCSSVMIARCSWRACMWIYLRGGITSCASNPPRTSGKQVLAVNVGFTNPRTGLPLRLPSLLVGFAFVAVFALGNKVLNAQRKQSEMLFRQLEESTREREMVNVQLQKY